jgi:hypothetical protein
MIGPPIARLVVCSGLPLAMPSGRRWNFPTRRAIAADRHGRRWPVSPPTRRVDRRHEHGIVPRRQHDRLRRLDQHDLMERFARWWRERQNSHNGRCFDIGITTRQALHRFLATGDPIAGSD